MENFPRKSPIGDRESSNSLAVEEFVPPSAWTEDQTCHYLLVDLPGMTSKLYYYLNNISSKILHAWFLLL